VMKERADSLVREGIAAAKAGDKKLARALLARALRLDAENTTAWLWLSGAVETIPERVECLERVLSIDPGHAVAQRGLELARNELREGGPSATAKPAPGRAAPGPGQPGGVGEAGAGQPAPVATPVGGGAGAEREGASALAARDGQTAAGAASTGGLRPELKPWDPMQLVATTAIISLWALAFPLAFNWRRLGKPQWFVRSLVLAVVLAVGGFGLGIGWIVATQKWLDIRDPLVISMPMAFALGGNVGYGWALERMQKRAYKKWQEGGEPALLAHVYDIDGAIAVGAIVMLVTTALVTGAFWVGGGRSFALCAERSYGEEVRFWDDFSDPFAEWEAVADGESSAEFEAGDYVVRAREQGASQLLYPGNCTANESDVYVQASVINPDRSREWSFGVVCGQHYIGVHTGGCYVISRAAGDGYEMLTAPTDPSRSNWTASRRIDAGASRYALRVDCGNGQVVLSIDGSRIARVAAPDVRGSRAGLSAAYYGSGEGELRFDDFVVGRTE
jgi:hypothetical protein